MSSPIRGWWGVFFLLAFASGALASEPSHFLNTRIDPSVPSSCREFELRDFSEIKAVVVYGIQGARRERFTHEYPVKREEARDLWEALRDEEVSSSVRENPRTRQLFDKLRELGPRMGFDFGKEGDVLEALALDQLKTEFPESQYFLTGGLAYRETPGSAPLGELDIIIARRADCRVIAIGEAKLGLGEINHARAQIKRFLNFAKRKLCRGTEKLPVCAMN